MSEPKKNFEVSPSGYGIHWPELDEDLSIDGMIKAAKDEEGGMNCPSISRRSVSSSLTKKYSKQIGLTIPPNVLARADKVIR